MDSTYRIPEEVLTAHVRDEAVLLNLRTKHYHSLNPTAAVIWKELERGSPRARIVEALCDRFDVGSEAAARGLDRLLPELAARELVELVAPRDSEGA